MRRIFNKIKNTGFLYKKISGTAILMVCSRVLLMISGIIYARYLGPDEFGMYTYAIAFISLASIPVMGGVQNLLIREVASYHLESKWKLLNGIFIWSRFYILIISILVLLLVYLAIYHGFLEEKLSNLLIFGIFLVPFRGLLVREGAILNGFMHPVLAQFPLQILAPFLGILILGICIFFGMDLDASSVMKLSLSATILSLFLSFFLSKWTLSNQYKKLSPSFELSAWHRSLVPLTLIYCLGTLNAELGSVLLGWLVDNVSVGYFKVAMQAVTLIILVLAAVNAVIMPNFTRLYKKDKLKEAQSLLTKSVRLSTFVSIPIFIVLCVFGKSLIILLFGVVYLEAYPILLVLCIGQIMNVLMGSVALVLNMTGNEKKTLKSLAISCSANLVFFYILIPLHGAIGAAISVSVGLILWNILMAIDVYRLTGLKTWIR